MIRRDCSAKSRTASVRAPARRSARQRRFDVELTTWEIPSPAAAKRSAG
ncbi:MAG: hypothetical protein H6745_17395 [Deltaproteobacteria bacterium]|nr:hypothetical protein [Deltaproteobacteria bacterium]